MEYVEQAKMTIANDLPLVGSPIRATLRRAGALSRFKNGSYLIAALLFAGLACIGMIGRWARSPGVSTKISTNLAVDAMIMQMGLGDSPSLADPRFEGLGALLRGEAREAQVPLSQVRCTPFVFGPGLGPQTQPGLVMPIPDPVAVKPADPRAEELARMNSAVERLQLESILVGADGPSAVISGATVMEGQEIEGWVVRKILPKKAILAWKEYTVTLTLR